MLLQFTKMPNSKECACNLQGPTVRTGRQHIGFTILPTRLMEKQLKRSTPYPFQARQKSLHAIQCYERAARA